MAEMTGAIIRTRDLGATAECRTAGLDSSAPLAVTNDFKTTVDAAATQMAEMTGAIIRTRDLGATAECLTAGLDSSAPLTVTNDFTATCGTLPTLALQPSSAAALSGAIAPSGDLGTAVIAPSLLGRTGAFEFTPCSDGSNGFFESGYLCSWGVPRSFAAVETAAVATGRLGGSPQFWSGPLGGSARFRSAHLLSSLSFNRSPVFLPSARWNASEPFFVSDAADWSLLIFPITEINPAPLDSASALFSSPTHGRSPPILAARSLLLFPSRDLRGTIFPPTNAAQFSESLGEARASPVLGGDSEASQGKSSISLPPFWVWIIASCAILTIGIIAVIVLTFHSRRTEETMPSEAEVASVTSETSETEEPNITFDFVNPMSDLEGGDAGDLVELQDEDEGLGASAPAPIDGGLT
jgi:hypothetical protein